MIAIQAAPNALTLLIGGFVTRLIPGSIRGLTSRVSAPGPQGLSEGLRDGPQRVAAP
jgi:hypothetical protein